jgi:hypothetical protein
MPTASLGHTSDDLAVGTLADHQGGFEVSIGLEMSDYREKLLMPGA